MYVYSVLLHLHCDRYLVGGKICEPATFWREHKINPKFIASSGSRLNLFNVLLWEMKGKPLRTL